MRIRVRISVEGFDPYRFESEIKIGLADHFKSCGEVLGVIAPIDPLVDRFLCLYVFFFWT